LRVEPQPQVPIRRIIYHGQQRSENFVFIELLRPLFAVVTSWSSPFFVVNYLSVF